MTAGQRKAYHGLAKDASVGMVIVCPGCGQTHVKATPGHKYRGTVCKDAYWNSVDPRKRNNAARISPASARYTAMRERDDVDEGPEGWDGHKDY
jgi:hypothetical protein